MCYFPHVATCSFQHAHGIHVSPMPPAAPATCRSWPARYRWRLGLDRAWAKGRRRLAHTLEGHHAWVNAVRLIPGRARNKHLPLRAGACYRCFGSNAAQRSPVPLPSPGVGVASGGSEGAINLW